MYSAVTLPHRGRRSLIPYSCSAFPAAGRRAVRLVLIPGAFATLLFLPKSPH